MKVIKLHRGDGAADPGGDGFAGVTHEVGDGEEGGRVGQVLAGLDFKVPEEPRARRTRRHRLRRRLEHQGGRCLASCSLSIDQQRAFSFKFPHVVITISRKCCGVVPQLNANPNLEQDQEETSLAFISERRQVSVWC